jgi:hypothetical protein
MAACRPKLANAESAVAIVTPGCGSQGDNRRSELTGALAARPTRRRRALRQALPDPLRDEYPGKDVHDSRSVIDEAEELILDVPKGLAKRPS